MAAGQNEVVLRPSRWKLAVQSAAALVFVAAGVVTIAKGAGLAGVLATLFFALCAAVFLAQLAPGASYLLITPEGFSFCTLFRKSAFMRWDDVGEFRAVRLPPFGRKIVMFDTGGSSMRGLRALNRALAGASAGLPDTYGMKARELAETMNTWRARATRSS